MDEVLLKIARDSILEEMDGGKHIDRDELISKHDYLSEEGAVFVTLNLEGDLRGCIGSLIAHRALVDDVIENAKAAAFRDPRFSPLSRDELDSVEIEISLLSPPKELIYSDENDLRSKIRAFEDGVILSLEGRSATFLPSVWEQLPDFDLFFEYLCKKAGLESNALKRHPQIHTYQARKIK